MLIRVFSVILLPIQHNKILIISMYTYIRNLLIHNEIYGDHEKIVKSL